MCSYPTSTCKNLYNIQRNLANKFGILFVDNVALFNKLPNIREYFSCDDEHPNEKGYKFLAENIYNCILENKLIK